ncbi:MAG: GFA family protein [Alphaproteobacteria bacterium]|nr:GFA family protein [Alphaproteobacteria bacterium]
MKVDGRCHCGAITYEAEIDPDKVSLCHCTDCQLLSGSPFRSTAFTLDGAFKLLTGKPKIYLKTGSSGAKRQQAFCPECGTPIYATSEQGGPVFGIRTSSIRQRAQLTPKVQIWTRSSQTWVDHIASVRKVEQAP